MNEKWVRNRVLLVEGPSEWLSALPLAALLHLFFAASGFSGGINLWSSDNRCCIFYSTEDKGMEKRLRALEKFDAEILRSEGFVITRLEDLPAQVMLGIMDSLLRESREQAFRINQAREALGGPKRN